jgi:nuclear pore complex protein Nup85
MSGGEDNGDNNYFISGRLGAPVLAWSSGDVLAVSDAASPAIRQASGERISARHVALANETHGVFATLQTAVAAARDAHDDAALRTALIHASTHYRALIVAHVSTVHRAINNNNNNNDDDGDDGDDDDVAFSDTRRSSVDALQREFDAGRTAHLIWHAAELFCVGSIVAPNAAGAPLMLQWLVANKSDRDSDVQDVETLAAATHAERSPLFWPLVERLAVGGRSRDAAALLALHSALRAGGALGADGDGVVHVRELLLRLPLATAATHSGDVAFLQAWRAWQRDCASLRQASAALRADAGTPLSHLFAIMCGDVDVIEDSFDSYDRLGAIMTFVEPCASTADVARHARRCLAADGIDGAVLALLRGDAYDALGFVERNVSQVPTSWLDAHLTDLLWHAGALEAYDVRDADATDTRDTATRLREARLLRYVDALAASDALASLDWSVLSTYWHATGALGEAHALLRFARAPVSSGRAAARLLSACESFGAAGAELASRIRAGLGLAALRRGRAGDAVRWLMASGDAERLTAVASLLLERFAMHSGNSGARHQLFENESRALDDDGNDGALLRAADVDAVLESLGGSYMFSGKIAFLSDYRRLHALWQAKDMRGYAQLTVDLLRVDVAPHRFWTTLLLNCLPLLEHDAVVFDAAQTQHLMRCLNELEGSHRRNEYLGGVHETDLTALRLALARNLARALVVLSATEQR